MHSPDYDVVIIGAGLSGLSVARFLRDKRPDLRLVLLEKKDTPGGAIKSHPEEGFLAEYGPHGFLDNCLESRVLVELAGLRDEVTKAPLKKYGRFICLNGKLVPIPQEPLKIIKAPLIPLPAKLRIAGELFRKPLGDEPSVSNWVAYRFGPALLPFADAVFTGTYAGDIKKLSIDAVMPAIRELEQQHGSVIRGLIRRRREAKKEKKRKKAGLPAMTSFSAGMIRLIHGLAAPLEARREILYQTQVRSLQPTEDGWHVAAGRISMTCCHLVIALPVNQALTLLAAVDTVDPPPLSGLPEAGLANVVLGFDEQANIPFGFGYLAPEEENRFTLGALFSSHMFPGRAPRGYQLVEALVGGRRHPERLDLRDNEMVDQVYADLCKLMDLPSHPCYSRVLRNTSGIPQLEAGSKDLFEWRRHLLRRFNTLHVCGFGWQGIGINDMAKEAWKNARRILARELEREENDIKGIYF